MAKIHFEPSDFEFIKDLIGNIKDHRYWLKDSLILNQEENLSLAEMSKSTRGHLLYRGTRDGFTTHAFHSRCDGKTKTITLIKNDLNYVFGGYASEPWNSSGEHINDPNAFLFSLRRDGKSFNDKFTIKLGEYALFGSKNHGPTFGGGHDIYICNHSNTSKGSYTRFGHSYFLPVRYSYADARGFLAGNYNEWLASEIEVYQIQ